MPPETKRLVPKELVEAKLYSSSYTTREARVSKRKRLSSALGAISNVFQIELSVQKLAYKITQDAEQHDDDRCRKTYQEHREQPERPDHGPPLLVGPVDHVSLPYSSRGAGPCTVISTSFRGTRCSSRTLRMFCRVWDASSAKSCVSGARMSHATS